MSAFAKDQVVTGKSVYSKGNASARGRSWMLMVTVVILLVGLVAWFTVYTRALETTRPDATQRAIDPARPVAPVSR
jgi:cytoskeletal protein RodZ